MQKSESINELATALSAMQGKLENVAKDATGYGYKYSTLGSILEAVRPLLCEFGLAVTQCANTPQDSFHQGDTFYIQLETLLLHKSGQWINSSLLMPVSNARGMTLAQSMGSVISYARRYMLVSILGLTQVDDDGASATGTPLTPVHIFPQHLPELTSLLVELNIAMNEREKWLTKAGVKTFQELTDEQIKALIEMLKKRKESTKNGV